LLSALSTALIKHKRIQTTSAKAKETRRIIEPLITRARDAFLLEKGGDPVNVHARREIAKFIRDKEALHILFSEIAEKVGKRPGGYTRVLKLGNRLGDNAEMAVIELVDYNEAQDNKQRKERAARSKAAAQRRKAADERKGKGAAAETKSVPAEATSAPAEPKVKGGKKSPAAKAAAVVDAAVVVDSAAAVEASTDVVETTAEVVETPADETAAAQAEDSSKDA
jgi:large subunit ribosomal protein L17